MGLCRWARHPVGEGGISRQRVITELRANSCAPVLYGCICALDHHQVMICTDIAARGLDMDHVDHVVQFEVAGDTIAYLHRIGRTAR